MESRIVNLETKITFQDDVIEQLNQVVIEQQKMIDRLSKKIDFLANSLTNHGEAGVKDISLETPPPHY